MEALLISFAYEKWSSDKHAYLEFIGWYGVVWCG